MSGYNLVSPLAEKDVDNYLVAINCIEKNLDVKGFVVIGNHAVRDKLEAAKDERIKYIDEDKLVSYDSVKEHISLISENNELAIKRTGWYLQQFLKISYSLICEDEYYLLWDADTIPIHRHEMFEDGSPVFDMKTEHHEPYYECFARMFPDCKKINDRSYISEHMIIKTEIMREIINYIQNRNDNSEPFYITALNSVTKSALPYSGFCDYDTYGLYCFNKYPELYKERTWDSLRPASRYYIYEEMTKEDYDWLLKDYDALSFEAGWKFKKYINVILKNSWVRKHTSCKKLLARLHQFTI